MPEDYVDEIKDKEDDIPETETCPDCELPKDDCVCGDEEPYNREIDD